MRRVQRVRSLLEPLQRATRRHCSVAQLLLERAAAQVLHDDVWPLVMLADVVDRDDVRIPGEARSGERLACEARTQEVILRVPVVENLDRDVTSERRVRRPV